MALKPYKQAVVTTGTYTDRSGAEKKRYVNVGTLFQYDDGGLTLKLDTLPVGTGWNGFISFYDLKERDGAKSHAGGESRADLDESDSIPF